jgi:hypothetical protein
MATPMYLVSPDTAAEGLMPGMQSDLAFWNSRYEGTVPRAGLSTARGSGVIGSQATTVASDTAGIATNASGTPCYISYPLSAAATISGTITFNLWGLESSMNANAGFNVRVYKCDKQGVMTLIVESAKGVELGTVDAVNNWTATPTSTSMAVGDRFVVFTGIKNVGTMGGSFTCTMNYNGTTAAASGDTYVQFNENLTFDTGGDPATTQIFLTDTASDVVIGASVDEKEAWTARGAGAVSVVRNTAAGPTAALQWTSSAGGNTIEWYTKQLQAVTLSGKILVKLRAKSSATGANAVVWVELAVVGSDGSSATVFAAGEVNPNNLGNSQPLVLTTTEQTSQCRLYADSVALTDGQRIRIRAYIEDQYGALATGNAPMAASQTCTLVYAGAAGATGDSFITFGQTLTEFVSVAAPPRYPAINHCNPALV